ncbi:MAG: hypothetical protein R3301_02605, partial [Saprospiraceae bacterium]|nr:hypothetical protein [Saprospiraceae bacterium]
MRDEITTLERTARMLHGTPEQRAPWNDRFIDYAEAFLHRLPDGKAYEQHDTSAAIYDLPIGEEGHDLEVLLDLVRRSVDTPGINPASGG